MTPAAEVFQLLALCAQRPGHPVVAAQLPRRLAEASRLDLVDQAEQQGLAPLLLAHIRSAKAAVPASVNVRLYAQRAYHARHAIVRRAVVGEAVHALASADIPVLVLKGAALAQIVYGDVVWRPMRDVDLLVRRSDAGRAYNTLQQNGFTSGERITARDHHHLPAVLKTVGDVTVVIELHHQLLPRTPFIAPRSYEDLRPAAQTFVWDGLALETLAREDMLWHVYAHAFAINVLSPGIRIISIADLIHATEAWVDVLDWDLLRREYPQLLRAMTLVHRLTPWSERVVAALDLQPRQPFAHTRALSSSLHWSGAASRDVLWPQEWWFRMRYGVDGPLRWLWYRAVGHPLRLVLSACATALRRIGSRRGGHGHRLLNE